MSNYEDELERLRSMIDDVDYDLYNSIMRRVFLTSEIGELKKEHNVFEMSESRQKEIYERLKSRCIEDGIPVSLITSIYDIIFEFSIMEQVLIINDK
jgi:chorismate mutase